MKRICVYCGAKSGSNPIYKDKAIELAKAMVERKVGLVYGGGCIGLMDVIATTVMESGGDVVGVIPKHLAALEIAHGHLTRLHVVNSMHRRKALMASLARGFIAMPGGWGTMDEFCEMITWAQIGLHSKPVSLLNVNGYFDKFLEFASHSVQEGFLSDEHRQMVIVESDPNKLIDRLIEAPQQQLEPTSSLQIQ